MLTAESIRAVTENRTLARRAAAITSWLYKAMSVRSTISPLRSGPPAPAAFAACKASVTSRPEPRGIDGMDLLRHGRMNRLFGGVRAPSRLGTFLRTFTSGHVRQLDSVAASSDRQQPLAAPVICATRLRKGSTNSEYTRSRRLRRVSGSTFTEPILMPSSAAAVVRTTFVGSRHSSASVLNLLSLGKATRLSTYG